MRDRFGEVGVATTVGVNRLTVCESETISDFSGAYEMFHGDGPSWLVHGVSVDGEGRRSDKGLDYGQRLPLVYGHSPPPTRRKYP